MMIATFTLFSKRGFSDFLEGVVFKNFSGSQPPDLHLSSASLPQPSFSSGKVKFPCLKFKEITRPVVSATLVYRQIGECILWHELYMG